MSGPSAAAAPEPDEEPPDPVIVAFDDVCDRLGGFDDRLGAELIDGYLTAIAASRRLIPLDEFLPKMCGDAFERAFADPQDEAKARAALQDRLDQIVEDLTPQALIDEPDTLRLAPLINVWDDESRRRLAEANHLDEAQVQGLQTGAFWAEGFLRVMADFAEDWPSPARRDKQAQWIVHALESIILLMADPAGEAYRSHVRTHWKDPPPTRTSSSTPP